MITAKTISYNQNKIPYFAYPLNYESAVFVISLLPGINIIILIELIIAQIHFTHKKLKDAF